MPYSIEKRNQFLNLTFPSRSSSNVTYSAPANLYLGLCTNDPVASNGTFNEVSGDTYARVLIGRAGKDLPNYMSDAVQGKVYNEKQITFNRAKANWPQVKGVGLFEMQAGGSPIFYATLKTPVDTAANQIFTFDPNTLIVQFADNDVEIEAEASAT